MVRVQQIQKCARGFIGRRKVLVVREKVLHERVSVVIQTTWRGLLARRKAGEARRDMELTRVCMRCAQSCNVDRFVSTQIRFSSWHTDGTDAIFVGSMTSLKVFANQDP